MNRKERRNLKKDKNLHKSYDLTQKTDIKTQQDKNKKRHMQVRHPFITQKVKKV